MNGKKARQYCRNRIREAGVKVVERVGRLYVVDSSAPFACLRCYGWCVARENHESIKGLRKEFRDSLHKPPPPHSITDQFGYRIGRDGRVRSHAECRTMLRRGEEA